MYFDSPKKLKAVTFSYDDGTTQDIRLIELLNKYGLKCTFNLNSGLWAKLEEFFKLISGKNDIFYGTNKDVLLDF